MQVHKRNTHSKRANNRLVNRAWKRTKLAKIQAVMALLTPADHGNRAARREPKRARYAANIAAIQAPLT